LFTAQEAGVGRQVGVEQLVLSWPPVVTSTADLPENAAGANSTCSSRCRSGMG
jgi:hypothetical protein